MGQLTLFEGPHLPRSAAREALARGELGEARAQLEQSALASEEAVDAARLGRINLALQVASDDPVGTAHEAFVSALADAGPRGFLSDGEWFRIYAQRMAGALDAEPGRRFRGWLGAHFAFVIGAADAARRAAVRIVESLPPGPGWIEAARLAFELGEAVTAREFDVMGQQGHEVDGLGGGGQPLEEVAEVGPRLDSVRLRGLDQGRRHG